MDSHAIDLKRKYLSKLASPDHKTQKLSTKSTRKRKETDQSRTMNTNTRWVKKDRERTQGVFQLEGALGHRFAACLSCQSAMT